MLMGESVVRKKRRIPESEGLTKVAKKGKGIKEVTRGIVVREGPKWEAALRTHRGQK